MWDDGKITQPLPTLLDVRAQVAASLATLRPDSKRSLNPTPYKVSLSEHLYQYLHKLWLAHAPIGQLE